MAEVSWGKLSTTMFNDDRVLMLSLYQQSDSIIVEWVKLLFASGKTNKEGIVADEYVSDMNPEYLKILEQVGLIHIDHKENIYVRDWDRFIKIDRECVINDGNYKDLRRLVFERDNYTCVYCGEEALLLEADHVQPKSRGGLDNAENLVCVCRSCNRSKKDKTPSEWKGRMY